jgi:hypothetical protein
MTKKKVFLLGIDPNLIDSNIPTEWDANRVSPARRVRQAMSQVMDGRY